jgi:hypothetical protein
MVILLVFSNFLGSNVIFKKFGAPAARRDRACGDFERPRVGSRSICLIVHYGWWIVWQ